VYVGRNWASTVECIQATGFSSQPPYRYIYEMSHKGYRRTIANHRIARLGKRNNNGKKYRASEDGYVKGATNLWSSLRPSVIVAARLELTDRFLVVGARGSILCTVPAATSQPLRASNAELAHHVRMFCVNHPVIFVIGSSVQQMSYFTNITLNTNAVAISYRAQKL
jgi:hypothetical protein